MKSVPVNGPAASASARQWPGQATRLGGKVGERHPVALGRCHPVTVPGGDERHALRAVPGNASNLEEEPVRFALTLRSGGGQHARGDAGAAPEMLLPRDQPGSLVGGAGRRPGLGHVAATARLRRDRAEPRTVAGHGGDRSLLFGPGGPVRIRDLFGPEPEREHRRVHRGDEGHRGVASRQDPENLGDGPGRGADRVEQASLARPGTPVSRNPAPARSSKSAGSSSRRRCRSCRSAANRAAIRPTSSSTASASTDGHRTVRIAGPPFRGGSAAGTCQAWLRTTTHCRARPSPS